jgi:hypothetical protein
MALGEIAQRPDIFNPAGKGPGFLLGVLLLKRYQNKNANLKNEQN